MLPECHGREGLPSGANPFVFQGWVPRFMPSSSGVTPTDRGIQCICGVRVMWDSSEVHRIAFLHHTRSVERHSEWEAANPTRARLRAAVCFKPGTRQNWNSKATGSRSSTQRLSYALPALDLVGAGMWEYLFPRCEIVVGALLRLALAFGLLLLEDVARPAAGAEYVPASPRGDAPQAGKALGLWGCICLPGALVSASFSSHARDRSYPRQ
jgi:hypothetical protein